MKNAWIHQRTRRRGRFKKDLTRKRSEKNAGFRNSLVLFTLSIHTIRILQKSCYERIFSSITCNLFLAARKAHVKYELNRSMSRFSFATWPPPPPTFVFSGPVASFSISGIVRRNVCGTAAEMNRCITSPLRAHSHSRERTARIAVRWGGWGEGGRGEFESTMKINLPSLTNPGAHKAAGGTDGMSC